jgi:hypothetical protein
MGFLDRDEDRYLKRIAEAVELIAAYIVSNNTPTATGVNVMALPVSPVAPGTVGTATATAVDAAGNTVPGAIAFTSTDDTLLTVVGDGSVSGVSVVTWTAVAAGSPILTSTFTNADGSTVNTGTNDPFTFTIGAAADVAVAVNVV